MASMNEARRTIAEGGAYVNNERVTDAGGHRSTRVRPAARPVPGAAPGPPDLRRRRTHPLAGSGPPPLKIRATARGALPRSVKPSNWAEVARILAVRG